MRRQLTLGALALVVVIGAPGPACADTSGGLNGPIVYTAVGSADAPEQAWSVNPDGSGRHELLAGHIELNTYPVWAPDGERLAFYRGRHLVVARADGSEEHEVLWNVGASVTWSPDGTRLAYTVGDDIGPGAELWVVNADGTDAHELYRADDINTPAWSPGGDVIVFGAEDPAKMGRQSVLWTIATDGTGLRQLTDFDPNAPPGYLHDDFAPAWSPDASRLVFTSNRDGWSPGPSTTPPQTDLYVMSSDGTGPVTRWVEPGFQYSPSWSPDGTSIAYSWMTMDASIPGSALEVWDLQTGTSRRLSPSANYNVSWSARPGSRPSADLSASIAADAVAVLPGSPVTLTATVHNAGPAPAEAAAVEVRAPGATLDASASPGCSPAAGGALRCAVGSLAAGGQASFAVRTTTGGPGVGEVSALAFSATSDPATTDNRAVLALAVCSQLGTAGQDRLRGTAGPDVLCGGGGDDLLVGGGGDDVLLGGPGKDKLHGGGGKDTASFVQARARVEVDLTHGRAAGGEGSDRLRRVENVVGSPYADRLTGSVHGNVLAGGAGADRLAPGGGRDRLDGGLGRDRVDYRDALRGVHVDLDKRTATGDGADRWRSIEGAWGSRFDDWISGAVVADWISGGGGDDVLEAQGGNDLISGGAGADVLKGGDGNDRFRGGRGVDRCVQDFGRGRSSQCERS